MNQNSQVVIGNRDWFERGEDTEQARVMIFMFVSGASITAKDGDPPPQHQIRSSGPPSTLRRVLCLLMLLLMIIMSLMTMMRLVVK